MWWSVLSKRQFGQACLQACFAPKQRLSILLTFRNFHLLGCHIPCLSCNTCQSLGKQLHLPPARKCSIQHWLLPWTLSQTGGLDWVIYVIWAYENSEASSKIPLIPLIWDVAPAGSCRLSLPVPWQNHPIFSYQGSVQNSPFWQKWMVDARSGQSILNSWFQGIKLQQLRFNTFDRAISCEGSCPVGFENLLNRQHVSCVLSRWCLADCKVGWRFNWFHQFPRISRLAMVAGCKLITEKRLIIF